MLKKLLDSFLNPFVFICLLLICFYLVFECSTLSQSYDALKESYSNLETEMAEKEKDLDSLDTTNTSLWNQLEEQNDKINQYSRDMIFLTGNIGFITDQGNKYHRFNCSYFNTENGWTAHNIEYCQALGYVACEHCNIR